jgi:hypothetical protein
MTRQHSAVDRILGIVRETTADLPEDSFALTVEDDSEALYDGVIISLLPRNPECAPIIIYAADDDGNIVAEVICGKDSRFELAEDATWHVAGGESFDEDLHAIVAAVIRGEFKETIWISRDEIIKSVGSFLRSGERIQTSAHHIGRGGLRMRSRRQDMNHAPYGDK